MKIGQYFDKEQRTLSAQLNLTWFATCTQDITNIRFINPAPVPQKQ